MNGAGSVGSTGDAGPGTVHAAVAAPVVPVDHGLRDNAAKCGEAVKKWIKANPELTSAFGGALVLVTSSWASPPVIHVVHVAGFALIVGPLAWRVYRGSGQQPVAHLADQATEKPKQD